MTRERRSLWGSITQSKKVNKVSMKAALVYTWAITKFDDDGFQPGEPRDIKVNVVPFRDDITIEDIKNIIIELNIAGLWKVFHVNSTVFIQDPVFLERQSYAAIHKIPSKIRPLVEKTPETVFNNTNGGVRCHLVGEAMVPKLSEVKLSKEKRSKEDSVPPVSTGQVKTQTQDPNEMTEAEFETYLKKSYPWANFEHEIKVIDRFIAKYPKVKKTRSLIIKHFNEVPKPADLSRKALLHAQAKELGVEKP